MGSFWNNNNKNKKWSSLQDNSNNLLRIIFTVSHYNCVNKSNSKSLILSKIRNWIIISTISSYELIFSIQQRIIQQTATRGKTSHAKFFNLNKLANLLGLKRLEFLYVQSSANNYTKLNVEMLSENREKILLVFTIITKKIWLLIKVAIQEYGFN